MIDLNAKPYRRVRDRLMGVVAALTCLTAAAVTPARAQDEGARRLDESLPPEYAAQVREIEAGQPARDAGQAPSQADSVGLADRA